MPYKDLDCVVLLRNIEGQDLYGESHVSVEKGQVATVINVCYNDTYEVEFDDDKADSGYGVLYAKGVDLAPFVENAV